MDSAAPSPAASLREQIARLENVAIAVQDLGRAWAHASDKIEAYREVLALIDAFPALREAAAPQVKGQHLLNPDSRLVNDPAFRFFILNFGCRSLRGTEDAFACAGCQEDYSALRERIMAAAPAQVDVEPIHCLDCPRPEECGGVVDPVKVALVQATRRPAQVGALADDEDARLAFRTALFEVFGPSLGAEVSERLWTSDAARTKVAAALRARSASPAPASDGATMIAAERARQVGAEGYDESHDDEHAYGEIAVAASCYAIHDTYRGDRNFRPKMWPWGSEWWKPKDPIRNLVRAGALIAAEIDRRLRADPAAASPAPTQPEGSETRETLEVASLPDPSGLPE